MKMKIIFILYSGGEKSQDRLQKTGEWSILNEEITRKTHETE